MSKAEKISVALSTELLDEMRGAVASGQYASTSELVEDALQDWKRRQATELGDVERLRKAWAVGMDNGDFREVDFEAVKRRGRERLARLKVD